MLTILRPAITTTVLLPFYSSKISAGFPSPADDYVEDKLDLNQLLIHNKPATYLVRVSGQSMQGAMIADGDLLVVDASIKPTDGKIVVASVDGEFTVKRFMIQKGKAWLQPENPEFSPIPINTDDDFSIFGVVTGVVRQIK